MEEIWRPIQEFEGRYEISSLGRVKSFLDSNGTLKKNGKLRKLTPDKDGYLLCMLRNNGRYYHKKVHRLVAEAFIPNPSGLNEVNHIDGNKQNNQVSNLEWSDSRSNNLHKTRVLGHYKGPIPPKRLRCVETKMIYPSVTAAAEAVGIKGVTNISHAAKNHHQSGGFHWEYI